MYNIKRRITALEAEQARTPPPDTLTHLFWIDLARAYGDGIASDAPPSLQLSMAESLALIAAIYDEEGTP